MTKKNSIFFKVLIPVIMVMLLQTFFISLELYINGTIKSLEDNAVKALVKDAENRKITLENMMVHNWSNLDKLENDIYSKIDAYLIENNCSVDDILGSREHEAGLLNNISDSLLNILRSRSPTGVFIYFIADAPTKDTEKRYSGLYYRDFDPISTPADYSDILYLRGCVEIARKDKIPLDSFWSETFTFSPENKDAWNSFEKPFFAALENPKKSSGNLSYWSSPHFIQTSSGIDYNECITYTRPLFYEGHLIGMVGTEIQIDQLKKYFPAEDFEDSEKGGYLLVSYSSKENENIIKDCNIYAVTGSYIKRLLGSEKRITLSAKADNNIYTANDSAFEDVHIALQPLKLYNLDSPFNEEQWALASIAADPMLFSSSRSVKTGILYASIFALLIGGVMLAIIIRHSTKPLVQIAGQIERGNKEEDIVVNGSNTYEIALLCTTINAMRNKQKLIEMALREERERYLVALESAADTFIEYDIKLDRFMIYYFSPNNQTSNLSSKVITSFIEKVNTSTICHHKDQGNFLLFLNGKKQDSVEIQMKTGIFPQTDDVRREAYDWFLFKASYLYDESGEMNKVIGIAKNITEIKQKELDELEASRRDSTTRLYNRDYGIRQIKAYDFSKTREIEDSFLCILQVDDFDMFEAYYGQVIGGVLLMYLARELQAVTGEKDIVIRMENDKFMIFFYAIKRKVLEEKIHQINKVFKRISDGGNPDLILQVSVGAAPYDHCTDYDMVFTRAYLGLQNGMKINKGGLTCYNDLPEKLKEEKVVYHVKPISVFLDISKEGIVSLVFDALEHTTDIHGVINILIRLLGELFSFQQIIICSYDADFNSNHVSHQWNDGTFQPYHNKIEKISQHDFSALNTRLDENGTLFYNTETIKNSSEGVRKLLCTLSKENFSGLGYTMYNNGIHTGMILFKSKEPDRIWNDGERFSLYEITRTISAHISIEKSKSASKAKSDFLSRMSHEIRTPMNAIIGMTSIARDSLNNPEYLEDCLAKIDFSSKHLLALINDVLDMSRIESGKLKITNQPFSLSVFLETVDILMRPQLESKNITFNINSHYKHNHVIGDEYRIRQVLVNLLGNAGKFTDSGGRVVFTLEETDHREDKVGYFRFCVQDTGIGIHKEDQVNVFKAFEQAESQKSMSKQQTGTGLGLAISSSIINAMNGKIELHSTLGKGSEFYFTLKLELDNHELTTLSDTENAGTDFLQSLAGKRILLVEDNEINLEITSYILEKEGILVEAARNGKEGVDMFFASEKGYYDVILMDIQMPVMDGLTATRQIRKNRNREDAKTIPIVAMTANAFDEDMKKSIESGMSGHLTKPVESDKLFAVLTQLLFSIE